MKKQFIFLKLLVLSLVLSTSCSSDDDGISQKSRDLFGTWELQSITQNNQIISLEDIPCEDRRGFTFRDNFTFTETTFAEESEECLPAASFSGIWLNIDQSNAPYYDLNFRRTGETEFQTLVIINFRTLGNTELIDVTESPNNIFLPILTYAKIN